MFLRATTTDALMGGIGMDDDVFVTTGPTGGAGC